MSEISVFDIRDPFAGELQFGQTVGWTKVHLINGSIVATTRAEVTAFGIEVWCSVLLDGELPSDVAWDPQDVTLIRYPQINYLAGDLPDQ